MENRIKENNTALPSKITIGICTYNRAESLARTLESLSKLKQAPERYEIYVVDNNCTDQTFEVVEKARTLFLCPLKYIKEPRQGLSAARNRVIAESQSEIIAFTDDDVLIDSEWLVNILKAYGRWPDAAVIGGRSSLLFKNEVPNWIGSSEKQNLCELDFGVKPIRLEKDQFLLGLNLSIKREWFARVGAFNENLGRVGSHLSSSEETEFLERVYEKGGKVYYDPDLYVQHVISPERLRKSWFVFLSYSSKRTSLRKRFIRDGRLELDIAKKIKEFGISILKLAIVSVTKGIRDREAFELLRTSASKWAEIREYWHCKFNAGRLS